MAFNHLDRLCLTALDIFHVTIGIVQSFPCIKELDIEISTNVEGRQDRISNLPMVLTDKILELLPLREAVKTSVLSKQWRNNWCYLKRLVFDDDFWKRQFRNKDVDQKLKWETYTSIINNSFLHHHGPIHEFYLYIPDIRQDNISYQQTLNLNPWLHFLSNNGVKKITIINYPFLFAAVPLPSHIYSCIKLEELTLSKGFIFKRPSTEFKCFKRIRKLELNITAFDGDMFSSLIASCPNLNILKLEHCLYRNNIVIDAPKLENLTLKVSSSIGLLNFKSVPNLAKLELCWCDSSITDRQTTEAADAIKNLAASYDLKSLYLRDYKSNKIFAAIGKKKLFPLALTHLYELSLGVLNLNDFGVFSCTFGFLQSCPSIKRLAISVARPSINVEVEHNYDYDNNYKLGNLVEVDIDGVTASKAELKLIEYVLSASIVLQRFTIKFRGIGDVAELKVQRKLNGFQRASPKTQIVF